MIPTPTFYFRFGENKNVDDEEDDGVGEDGVGEDGVDGVGEDGKVEVRSSELHGSQYPAAGLGICFIPLGAWGAWGGWLDGLVKRVLGARATSLASSSSAEGLRGWLEGKRRDGVCLLTRRLRRDEGEERAEVRMRPTAERGGESGLK